MALQTVEKNQNVLLNQQQKFLSKLGCIEDVLVASCSSVENQQELSTSLEQNKEKRKKLLVCKYYVLWRSSN